MTNPLAIVQFWYHIRLANAQDYVIARFPDVWGRLDALEENRVKIQLRLDKFINERAIHRSWYVLSDLYILYLLKRKQRAELLFMKKAKALARAAVSPGTLMMEIQGHSAPTCQKDWTSELPTDFPDLVTKAFRTCLLHKEPRQIE